MRAEAEVEPRDTCRFLPPEVSWPSLARPRNGHQCVRLGGQSLPCTVALAARLALWWVSIWGGRGAE
jgi:hypothetical protein